MADVEDSIEKVTKLLTEFAGDRGDKIRAMMDGKIGEIFMTAPASAKQEFHSCYPGGLAVHSLNVVMNLFKLSKALSPGLYSKEKLIFVGLFHDLGKVGDGEQEYYLPHGSDWHKKQGILYEINKKCVYMPTAERGIFILQKHGIELDTEEYLAIRLNDGPYVDENRPYRMKEPELSLLVHWADLWAVKQEKREHEKS